MERKEDRRVTMTKRMMKDAFIEMLKETDIYHISVRELCQRADVNRTTFYKYYGNQFDLLERFMNVLEINTADIAYTDHNGFDGLHTRFLLNHQYILA